MTRDEFDSTRWGANMYANHDGAKKYIVAVDFEEGLIALINEKREVPAEEFQWVRCESVEICND